MICARLMEKEVGTENTESEYQKTRNIQEQ